MQYAYNLVGPGEAILKTLKLAVTASAGVLLIKEPTTYEAEALPASTTAAADAFGVALSGGTYATSAEATALTVVNPFQVLKAKISASATADTAFSASSRLLTQTSASTTVITSTAVDATPTDGGMIYCLDGANAGLCRRQTSHSDGASYTVTVAFPNSVAVGDHCLFLPFVKGSAGVQLTTDIKQADGNIEFEAAGIDSAVVDVELTTPYYPNPEAWVYFVLGDHIYNTVD